MVYEANRGGLRQYLSDRTYRVEDDCVWLAQDGKYKCGYEAEFTAVAVGMRELIVSTEIKRLQIMKWDEKMEGWMTQEVRYNYYDNKNLGGRICQKIQSLLDKNPITVRIEYPDDMMEPVAEKFVWAQNVAEQKIKEGFWERVKSNIIKNAD